MTVRSIVAVVNTLPMPTGVRVAWVVLSFMGVALVAFALTRVPDRILHDAGPACRLEEQ